MGVRLGEAGSRITSRSRSSARTPRRISFPEHFRRNRRAQARSCHVTLSRSLSGILEISRVFRRWPHHWASGSLPMPRDTFTITDLRPETEAVQNQAWLCRPTPRRSPWWWRGTTSTLAAGSASARIKISKISTVSPVHWAAGALWPILPTLYNRNWQMKSRNLCNILATRL